MTSIYPHTIHSEATTNLESVVCVTSDLVSDRSIWRKVTCIVLCLVFLLNAWAVVILHVTHLSNETILELTVSLVTLLVGQYIVTGIIDGYIYWKRWSMTTKKAFDKAKEQNKEAWVCMRTTLNLLGMAPISRYIEALVIIRRLITVEKRYLPEALAFVKEIQQPSTLPSGSLISAPAARPHSSKSSRQSGTPSSVARINALDSGVSRIYQVRRQFRRSEHDSSLVALASGAAGAGPFIVAQGVLYFRRVGLNYPMATTTVAGIFACTITGLIWFCAGLTHFYPAALDQSEWDFDRGIGQIPISGLALLFFTHLVHVALRTGSLVLFTAQFYWVVLGVLGFHFLLVLMSLVTARWCTGVDYSKRMKETQADVSGNLLPDVMFAFVGLFDFVNAQAKYTRTRYLIYYFFYYLENAAMVGAWYVHFTYPGMWYYLPSLLVITIVQFLGFILLQVYLYMYSRAKRKTTLCGFCFARRDPELQVPVDTEIKSALDQEGSLHRFDSVRTGSGFMENANTTSMLSGLSGISRGMMVKSHRGLHDPLFGQQITQAALPKSMRHGQRAKSKMMYRQPSESMSFATNSRLSFMHVPDTNNQSMTTETQRGMGLYKHHSRHQSEIPMASYGDDPAYNMDSTVANAANRTSYLLPVNAEEAVEQEVSTKHARYHPERQEQYPSTTSVRQKRYDGDMSTRHGRPKSAGLDRNLQHSAVGAQRKGQFQPQTDFSRQKWSRARINQA